MLDHSQPSGGEYPSSGFVRGALREPYVSWLGLPARTCDFRFDAQHAFLGDYAVMLRKATSETSEKYN
jgi:hypothetical protein